MSAQQPEKAVKASVAKRLMLVAKRLMLHFSLWLASFLFLFCFPSAWKSDPRSMETVKGLIGLIGTVGFFAPMASVWGWGSMKVRYAALACGEAILFAWMWVLWSLDYFAVPTPPNFTALPIFFLVLFSPFIGALLAMKWVSAHEKNPYV